MQKRPLTGSKKGIPAALTALLSAKVRSHERDGQTWFVAEDLVRHLLDTDHPTEAWAEMKRSEPALESAVEVHPVMSPDSPGMTIDAEVLNLTGVLRLIEEVRSPKARKLKDWLAASAADRLHEAANPDFAQLRSRDAYRKKGYDRRWVDRRVGGVSARQEATSEWASRGVSDNEQFRALTNAIMEAAFGMDTTAFRAHKGLTGTTDSLRDHMSALELALTTLGETLAVTFHRDRNSHGFEALLNDVGDAGRIVARTRSDAEQALVRPAATAQDPAPARKSA